MIWNPSSIALFSGRVVLSLETVSGIEFGTFMTEPLNLVPGGSTVTMSGRTFLNESRYSPSLSEFFSKYLRGDTQDVVVTGLRPIDIPVKWLQDAIGRIDTTVPFPGADANFNPVDRIRVVSMSVRFSDAGELLVSGVLQAPLTLPSNINPSILHAVSMSSFHVVLVDPETHAVIGSMNAGNVDDTIDWSRAPLLDAPHQVSA